MLKDVKNILSLSISEKTLEKLKHDAQLQDRSLSYVARKIIEQHYNNQ